MKERPDNQALQAVRIIVPESRELDRFSAMLEKFGAKVVRCPLVLIRALQDNQSLDAWIERLVQDRHDFLLFYTGEGVSHIVARADQIGLRSEALSALAKAQKIARGPKPGAALRKLGLNADLVTKEPTTDGLLALLATLPLQGRCVGVQLYPEGPETRVGDAIALQGARFDPVLPYRYASDEQDDQVANIIRQMAAGEVDLIAFTSKLQVERLSSVANQLKLGHELDRALKRTRIAAIGPVAADAVVKAGGTVDVQPASNFHLKPFVSAIIDFLGGSKMRP